MAIVARSTSPLGLWENSPYNPLVHTESRDERWWSKGHGTIVDTPDGKWYIVYHAYEKDYYTLGRQTLLEPVEWTEDGWPTLSASQAALPMTGKPLDLSDDFASTELGWQWRFYRELDSGRYEVGDGVLKLRAQGESVPDSGPLVIIPPDCAYEAQVRIRVTPEAEAGLVLFYNDRCYAGIGFTEQEIYRLRRGAKSASIKGEGNVLYLKIRNVHHTVRMFYSVDGTVWKKYPFSLEVSGYHHNAFGEFLGLRLGLYAAGKGTVEFSDFRYRTISGC
jgi:beta-xylosidase